MVEYVLVRKTTGKIKKWFFNIQSVLLALLLFLNFILIAWDPEIISDCFARFADAQDSISFTRILSGSYILLVLSLLITDLLKVVFSYKQLNKLPVNENIYLEKLVFEMCKKLNLKHKVKCYISNDNLSPFVWGIFRFKLILSKNILNMEQDKLKLIISHELIHIRDNDSAWLLISHLCKRILIFNPLIYSLNRKHSLSVEIAADELSVLSCKIKSEKLTESIIEIAAALVKRDSVLQLNISHGFRHLSERIKALSTIETKPKVSWKFYCSLITACSFSVGLVVNQTYAYSKALNLESFKSVKMCSQIYQEKIIENLIKAETSKNRCE